MARPTIDKSLPSFWRVLTRFRPWIARERPLITRSMGYLFLGVVLRLAEPWPLKFVLDAVIVRPGAETWASTVDIGKLLWGCAIAVVLFSGFRALADYLYKVGFARVGIRVLREVRDHVYRHLQGLSLAFHNKARGGDLLIRVTRDVSLLRDVTSTALLPMIANIFVLGSMAIIMSFMEWRLTLAALAVVPLFIWITKALGTRIRDAARKQRKREGAMASTAAESLNAIRDVQALSLEGRFADGFSSRNASSQKEEMRASRLTAALARSVDVLLALATAIVLWYGGHLVLAHSLTPGDLVIFLTYLKRAFNPAKDMAKYAGRLAKAAAAGERVLEILDKTPDIHDRPGAIEAPARAAAIRFEGVSFSYDDERPAVRDVDFEIPAGATAALVGPSGHGKSTLCGLVLRLFDPTQGRVTYDDRDLRDFTISSWRRRTAVVLQESVLFAETARENIALGAPGATDEEILKAARLANADGFIERLPEGWNTTLGERGVDLSAGQRQRVALARAAVRRAPVLILDEPTTGLDQENAQEVIAAIDRLAEGRTTLLVTHDPALARRADVVFFVENGRIVEQGPPDALLASGGRFAALAGTSQENDHAG